MAFFTKVDAKIPVIPASEGSGATGGVTAPAPPTVTLPPGGEMV